MAQPRTRVLPLVSAALCCFIIGAFYMWSVFNAPLMAEHGWSAQEVSLAYSIYTFTLGMSTLAGGWLQRTISSRVLLTAGGMGFALAWILTSFATSLPMLYICFGVLGGFCDGLVYNVSMSVATKWYPDKKGLANGICIGCAGLAPLLFAPLGNALIEAFDTSACFRICGIGFVIAFVVATRFAVAPPEGWAPQGWVEGEESAQASAHDYNAKEMLKTPLFYMLWAAFVMAATSGLMMTGHAATIGQQLAGLSSSDAAVTVGLLAVASFTGRLGLGALSDKLGRFVMLGASLAVTCVVMLVFFSSAHTFVSFSVVLFLVGVCFGGVMTVMPSICGDVFGLKNFGFNYAVLFSGYTVASFVGPSLAATVVTATGSYDLAFTVAGILAAFGLAFLAVAVVLFKRMRKA